jgi:hypothetical protein
MGKPDQFAKRILQEETPEATGHRVTFEVPPEVPVGALQPDGVMRVVRSPGLAELDAPWSRLREEATLDIKMPGDHTDRAALARCELRRHARWVQRLEALRAADRNPPTGALATREPPDPRDYVTWVVAPHAPQWLRDDAARGVFTLERVAPGCWRIGPGIHETLWISANELPLRRDLVPFLVARSGRALLEFLLWAAQSRGHEWTLNVVKELDMSAETVSEIIDVPADDEAQNRIKTEFTRKLLALYPDAANEIREKVILEGIEKGMEKGIEKGAAQTLSRQFERRLARPLTANEHDELVERIHTLGPSRLGDVVIDLSPVELVEWLRDPDAR